VAYTWKGEDEDFSKAWEEAYEEATDDLEQVAHDRAVEKSDSLMAMFLKARRPNVYRSVSDNAGDKNSPVVVEIVKFGPPGEKA
jgi:hypothetical protein